MANDAVSGLNAAFKYVQRNFMGSDVPKAAGPLSQAIKSAARVEYAGGKDIEVHWSHKKYPGVGMGPLTEGGAYATALASSYASPKLGLAHMNFTSGWSGHALAMGSGQDMAYLSRKLVAEKTAEIRDKVASVMGRFMVNDGTPVFARAGTLSTNTFPVTSGSIHMFREGESVFCNAAASGSSGGDLHIASEANGIITRVDHQNAQVTVTTAGSIASGDYVGLYNFYGGTVPNGIRNLFAATTGTVQNINRATAGNHFYIPNVVTFSGALTGTMMDQLRDLVMDIGGERGSYKSKWVFNRAVRRWASLATIGQNRFASLTDLQLGNSEMKIADKDGVVTALEDPYLRDGEVFAVDPSKCVLAYPKGMEGGYFVEDGSGSIFWRAVSGAGYADAETITYVLRYNLGADDFRCQGYGSGFVSP